MKPIALKSHSDRIEITTPNGVVKVQLGSNGLPRVYIDVPAAAIGSTHRTLATVCVGRDGISDAGSDGIRATAHLCIRDNNERGSVQARLSTVSRHDDASVTRIARFVDWKKGGAA